jgi:hypothetical protein
VALNTWTLSEGGAIMETVETREQEKATAVNVRLHAVD